MWSTPISSKLTQDFRKIDPQKCGSSNLGLIERTILRAEAPEFSTSYSHHLLNRYVITYCYCFNDKVLMLTWNFFDKVGKVL